MEYRAMAMHRFTLTDYACGKIASWFNPTSQSLQGLTPCYMKSLEIPCTGQVLYHEINKSTWLLVFSWTKTTIDLRKYGILYTTIFGEKLLKCRIHTQWTFLIFFWLTVNPTYKELSARWEVDSTPDARATAPTATRRTTCTKAPLDSGTQLTPGMIQQVPRTRGDRAIMKHSSQEYLLYRGTTATWMNSTVSYFLKYNSSLKEFTLIKIQGNTTCDPSKKEI